MKLNPEFCELLDNINWKNEFIGYGNPNAKILIIGQEAAYGPDENDIIDYNKFYKDNFYQWNILRDDLEDKYSLKSESYYYGIPREKYCFPDYFVPNSPYFPKENKLWHYLYDGVTGEKRRVYSTTYYWYQRLIDGIYSNTISHKYFNFFDKAFITELNGTPRKNHNAKLDVNGNEYDIMACIRHRFDLFKQNPSFWSRFKIIIFACGGYATALQIKNYSETISIKELNQRKQLFSSIFGSAEPFFCGQLSRQFAHKNVQKIIQEIKSNPIVIDWLNKNSL